MSLMIDDPKDPNEMTTEEAADYLFPSEVVEHLRSAVVENDSDDTDSSDDES